MERDTIFALKTEAKLLASIIPVVAIFEIGFVDHGDLDVRIGFCSLHGQDVGQIFWLANVGCIRKGAIILKKGRGHRGVRPQVDLARAIARRESHADTEVFLATYGPAVLDTPVKNPAWQFGHGAVSLLRLNERKLALGNQIWIALRGIWVVRPDVGFRRCCFQNQTACRRPSAINRSMGYDGH
ncbi:hypothetical protein [Sphingopyxis sp. DBS4]|uniref:hypothetical protein n=1 Tax=Sphingopyxis sp. DBS4 TaxID=2968500 RepID=UPI00214BE602|nr:hypothetical protein [Sphingopyxis sp. DBS4]